MRFQSHAFRHKCASTNRRWCLVFWSATAAAIPASYQPLAQECFQLVRELLLGRILAVKLSPTEDGKAKGRRPFIAVSYHGWNKGLGIRKKLA